MVVESSKRKESEESEGKSRRELDGRKGGEREFAPYLSDGLDGTG